MAQLLTINEAAEILSVKPATVRAWLAARKNLPSVRCGRCIRIPAEAVADFIKRNTVPVRDRPDMSSRCA